MYSSHVFIGLMHIVLPIAQFNKKELVLRKPKKKLMFLFIIYANCCDVVMGIVIVFRVV